MRPELVGNSTRVLVSDLSGRSNILVKAEECGLPLDSKDPITLEILEEIKEMENRGYQFEGAEASFELLMRRAMGKVKRYFEVMAFRVIDTRQSEDQMPLSEATVKVRVGGKIEHTAADGNGPVNALDRALRKALESFYPQIAEMNLLDYKVRVLPAGKGTESFTRVLVESGDKDSRWGTVGVSENIIDASYHDLGIVLHDLAADSDLFTGQRSLVGVNFGNSHTAFGFCNPLQVNSDRGGRGDLGVGMTFRHLRVSFCSGRCIGVED